MDYDNKNIKMCFYEVVILIVKYKINKYVVTFSLWNIVCTSKLWVCLIAKGRGKSKSFCEEKFGNLRNKISAEPAVPKIFHFQTLIAIESKISQRVSLSAFYCNKLISLYTFSNNVNKLSTFFLKLKTISFILLFIFIE